MRSITPLLLVLLLAVTAAALFTACTQTDDPAETNAPTGTGEDAPASAEPDTQPVTAPDTQPETDPPAPETDPATDPETIPETDPETAPDTQPVEEVFEPVVRLIVCSDTHISSRTTTEADRFRKMMKTAYAYAEGHPSYHTVDALIIAGDFTNDGSAGQYTEFKAVADSAIRADETKLITVMGNHEFFGGNQDVYVANMDRELNVHEVVKGFHIIGVSPDPDSQSYDSSLTWLRKQVTAAEKDAPGRPIFTFQHHHLADTVYVSRSWYTPTSMQLKKLYGMAPEIINFSGHSHGPVNNPISIWQDGFTMLGTGTLSYFEMEVGMSESTVPAGAGNAAQFYVVEVDADDRVRIMPYDLIAGDFFRTPSNTDDPGAQLIYTIDDPSDPSTFLYTTDRYETATAPRFAEDAAITILNVKPEGVEFTIPQALDDQCIYGYRAVLTADGARTVQYKCYAPYYFEPMPETHTIRVNDLQADTTYTLSVYPFNVFDKEGEPITCTLKTPPYSGSAESDNPVNYAGTFTNFDSLKTLTRSKDTFAYGGSIGGDVFGGDWNNNTSASDVVLALAPGRGWNGSTALSVRMTAGSHSNRAVYVFATEENGNQTLFESIRYVRVWVDFTGIEFRKASFGLVTSGGTLYSTDDFDNRSDQAFYLMAEGTNEWKTMYHGNDGCFGAAQDSPMKDFKGWLAFPVADMGDRAATGRAFSGKSVSGVYMYWDLNDNSMLNTDFYLDEIHLVEDYKVFAEPEA